MAALLIGAPKVARDVANVRLRAGSWVVMVKGLRDSILNLLVGDSSYQLSNGEHKLALANPCEARIEIHKRGTEDYVTVIAECQR